VDWLDPDRLVALWLVAVWLVEVERVVVAGAEAVLLALVMARVKALVRLAWLLVSSR